MDRFSMDWFRLDGKVAMVTGANQGLGMAYAVAFAKAGADLFIPHFTEDVSEIKALIEKEGRRVHFLRGDLTQRDYQKACVEECMKQYGRIDILVNNAGDGDHHTTTEDCSNEFWDKMIALNQSSVLYFCRAVLPYMRKQGSGSIVNLSAIAGVYGNAGVSYSAAKAAVIAMTKNIAVQYTGTEIRCNAVCPGPTMVDRMDGREDALYNKEFMEITERHMDMSIPFARAEDQANVILFLASDLSRAITGQAIVTDNGRCL